MLKSRWGRRAALSGVGAVGALALGVSAASAHHCYVPMYSLDGPSSPNWFVVSAQMGAEFEGIEAPTCDAAVAAGYAALRAEGLPVGIKIFEKMTIGDPKGTGRMNPNGADGKGLEYFGADSQLPMEMVMTWVAAAEEEGC